MTKRWTAADMPRQDGRIALVTGANRGLGLEIASALASAGATVVMGCRDPVRARSAIDLIRYRVPKAQLEVMELDLAALASVRQFAKDFAAQFPSLDLLCNNASAILVPYGRTRDGFETHLGTNHLGHFALTGLLLERLSRSPAPRIVNTSSVAHRMTQGIDFDDLNFDHRPYRDMDAYGASKLAALLFTFELDRRFKRAGVPGVAAAAHPGWTATNLDVGNVMIRVTTRLFAQSPQMGALPALYAATMPDVQGGDFFGPGGFQQLTGFPRRVDSRPEARDPDLARVLWERSQRLTGVRMLDA